ncbi:branched-chain amino acid ABC transporter permease [Verticiella sediminum]|uniref:Branched-chain amino acid ABC transporter permease n=1 Tax=Verticiella sediminum TaxID=1247510 RepID=A0A556AXJ0_9BURK|nr:branched-chain amino acid ABC transporter permease [Verticiella sediminum]TSH97659.1 branched-chain amino acid ABC transporter permease [Verticiella sediminum]
MLLVEQLLNGLQYSALLFLLASGLTLIFGIMGVVNLAHGSFYMVGAFAAAWATMNTGSLAFGALAAIVAAAAYGLVIERTIIRRLYRRSHLDQVLATLAIVFFTNELVTVLFGRSPILLPTPAWLATPVEILPGLPYPLGRLLFIAIGAAVAVFMWLLINHTRLGMLIRAGADDHDMVDALGVRIGRLYTGVFVLGCALCGLAGLMTAPLLAVETGMGERVLISTFVVIVVGGVGSVRGALAGALAVGMVDSLGRAYIPALMDLLLPPSAAVSVAGALVSASIYIFMAIVLLVRPRGLLPMRA